MKDLIGRLSQTLGISRPQTERTAALFEDGNTVPFVARYRKEITGGLDEAVLADFRDKLNALRHLDDRQKTVLKTIGEQGKLTPELEDAIEEAETLQQVEDLYLPYKPKRRTRAEKARERGLEPVAEWIWQQVHLQESRNNIVKEFLSEEVPTAEDAWQGARDIVAEWIAEDASIRDRVRRLTWDRGDLSVVVADADIDHKKTYELYYDLTAGLRRIKPHQVLAINRGEADGVLRVKVTGQEETISQEMVRLCQPDYNSTLSEDLLLAVDDAYHRLIAPSIEREIRRELKSWADDHAINVFSTNLRNLLLTPPLKGERVLAVDPAFRTGCKLAILDETSRLLETMTIYPHPPQSEWQEALDELHEVCAAYDITLIVIGNGTASRETEELVATLIDRHPGDHLRYLIVNEAGASVYSASPLARQEFPELDVSLRGAVSIGRRAQDPLAELVKIDPRSIGVGMYQHDVDQTALDKALAWVTESVVNQVGVDLNTASPALLKYVAGLGPKLAASIVSYRDQHGEFQQRDELMRVSGLGARSFEQAAGFLRIRDSVEPLDNTGIHPESYPAARAVLKTLGCSVGDPALKEALRNLDTTRMHQDLGVGLPTLQDIIKELQAPGRDPREDVPPPVLRQDVLRMEDLVPGMSLSGTVRNVVDFGAFVDIGVKQDGLVHISEMADYRVESPYEVVGVGDVLQVKILSVDIDRGRIALSMKS